MKIIIDHRIVACSVGRGTKGTLIVIAKADAGASPNGKAPNDLGPALRESFNKTAGKAHPGGWAVVQRKQIELFNQLKAHQDVY